MSRQAADVLTEALAPRSELLRRALAGGPSDRRTFLLAHAARTWIFSGALERRPPCA